MLTNPNTCGLFEDEILRDRRRRPRGRRVSSTATAPISTRSSGACGRPISASTRMHLNLHKTFSTPHGGGGPGSGPGRAGRGAGALRAAAVGRAWRDGLAPGRARRGRRGADASAGSRAFHGQMGMFVRALAYMMSHGADGLRQVAEDAVLNANYLRARLAGRADAVVSRHLHARGAVRRPLPRRTPASPRSISPRR